LRYVLLLIDHMSLVLFQLQFSSNLSFLFVFCLFAPPLARSLAARRRHARRCHALPGRAARPRARAQGGALPRCCAARLRGEYSAVACFRENSSGWAEIFSQSWKISKFFSWNGHGVDRMTG
jgi:hypothetical protein